MKILLIILYAAALIFAFMRLVSISKQTKSTVVSELATNSMAGVGIAAALFTVLLFV